MDYNKSFLSYETISSARCQTQAAAEAVQKIGLILIKDVDPSWFADGKTSEIFFQRLDFWDRLKKQRINLASPVLSTQKRLIYSKNISKLFDKLLKNFNFFDKIHTLTKTFSEKEVLWTWMAMLLLRQRITVILIQQNDGYFMFKTCLLKTFWEGNLWIETLFLFQIVKRQAIVKS